MLYFCLSSLVAILIAIISFLLPSLGIICYFFLFLFYWYSSLDHDFLGFFFSNAFVPGSKFSCGTGLMCNIYIIIQCKHSPISIFVFSLHSWIIEKSVALFPNTGAQLCLMAESGGSQRVPRVPTGLC